MTKCPKSGDWGGFGWLCTHLSYRLQCSFARHMTACGNAVYSHLSRWQFWVQLHRKGLAPCLKRLNHGKACPDSHFWSVIKTSPYIIVQKSSYTACERGFLWEKRHISCHLKVFGCVKMEWGCFSFEFSEFKLLSLELSVFEFVGCGPYTLWPSATSVPQETLGFMGKSLLHFIFCGLETATKHPLDPFLDQTELRVTCWPLLEWRIMFV